MAKEGSTGGKPHWSNESRQSRRMAGRARTNLTPRSRSLDGDMLLPKAKLWTTPVVGATQRDEMPKRPAAPVTRLLPVGGELVALMHQGEHIMQTRKKGRRKQPPPTAAA